MRELRSRVRAVAEDLTKFTLVAHGRRLRDGDTVEDLSLSDGDEVYAVQSRIPLVTSASADQVRVWRADTGALVRVLRGHRDLVCSVLILGGHELVSGCRSGAVHIWCLQSGELLRTLEVHRRPIMGLAELPSRPRAALASASADGTVRVWSPMDGECKQVLEGHSDVVFQVASLSGDRLASVSKD